MKKITALLLLMAMLLPMAVSCSDTEISESADTSQINETSVETEPDKYQKAKDLYAALPSQDLEGIDFMIAAQAATGNSEKEIWVEELTGDAVNDATYNRNLVVNERYNCSIQLNAGDVNAITKQAVTAGDDSLKLAFPNMATASSMAQMGYLVNYLDMPNLNLSEAWWDQGTLAMEIAGKVYYMNGDINILDNDVTYIQLFNKQLIIDVGLEEPYQLVREGKWTIDMFQSMCKDVTTDLDGNGEFTDSDRYGYVTTGEGPCTFFYGSGLTLVSYDDEGVPYLNIDMEKTTAALEKVVDIISKDNITRIPSDVAVGKAMFMEDRVLFYGEVLSYVPNVRDMETPFGVLPIPKYDEAQDNYYTYCNAISSTACVPKTGNDINVITAVLEAMAIQSYIQITPAYYDIALARKYTRDDDSAEMLDIALAYRVYDIGRFFSQIGIGDIFQNCAKNGSTNFASELAKKENSAKTKLEQIIEDFSAQE